MTDTQLQRTPADRCGRSLLRRPKSPRRSPGLDGRGGIISWVLIVLASLLIPISVVSVWAIRTVTDTDQYVTTMAPLARDPVIIDHLAEKATDALVLLARGPEQGDRSPPGQGQAPGGPHHQSGQVLRRTASPSSSSRARPSASCGTGSTATPTKPWSTSWKERRDPSSTRVSKNGAIVVNVVPALNTIVTELDQRGVTLFNPVKAIASTRRQGPRDHDRDPAAGVQVLGHSSTRSSTSAGPYRSRRWSSGSSPSPSPWSGERPCCESALGSPSSPCSSSPRSPRAETSSSTKPPA